jgi:hypothetical protein
LPNYLHATQQEIAADSWDWPPGRPPLFAPGERHKPSQSERNELIACLATRKPVSREDAEVEFERRGFLGFTNFWRSVPHAIRTPKQKRGADLKRRKLRKDTR